MSIFCRIGLPGFIVVLMIAVAPIISMIVSFAIVDKVI